ncbi:FRG domain-containing protein [Candidatus Thiodictyon syntrophicum]|jgi:hypothetical protein|uniref:FRG domain-containing protein n=1 Tax=Candidatus Thiodictyon syntrophicum TaxID=1166950 RepID=A0A2K8UC53_9GAMM|nr:FRG domain-containing protein [Candidatus Thiodictyon syntrophicum]AUB83087.1 hypothetical protein THSYN_20490 [Candidatus Thiodictyon syntrophicum]
MITDIPSLLAKITLIEGQHPNETLFFRGQVKRYRPITPSIDRNGYLSNENVLFREFILRNPDEFSGEKSTFEKLVKMQHYKLPTRLLDITTNPLIALFFAVANNDSEDGDFIVFAIPDEKIKYYDSDTISVVANIARRPIDTLDLRALLKTKIESNDQFRTRFNGTKEIQYLLHEIKEEKPYFKDLIEREHLEDIWCVKPLLKNRRIIKQDGAFLLFGIHGTKEHMATYSSFTPIDVPVLATEKEKLRKDLKLLGISNDKIFPELDNTAEYLRSIYARPHP